jgi:predicted O-linked N-acetylglucosamine transferase (SPINDLY family)
MTRSDNAQHLNSTLDEACSRAMTMQLGGELDRAAELYRAVLRAEPSHAAANHCLGMLHMQLQRPAEGLPYLEAALNVNPQIPDYWLGYLEALLAAAQLDAAGGALSLGREHGLAGAAVEDFERRLGARLSPLTAAPLTAMAQVAVPAIAIPLATAPTAASPLASEPSPAAAHPTTGSAIPNRAASSRVSRQEDSALQSMVKQGRFAEAVVLARNMTERSPDHAIGWKTLGALLWWQQRTDEALAPMQRAAQLLPTDAEAQNNVGMALLRVSRVDEASTYCRRALEIDRDFAAAHFNLGMVHFVQERYIEAVASLRQAISLRPDYLKDEGPVHSDLLFLSSHDAALDADSLFAEHRQFGEYFETPVRASWPQHTNPKDPERCLRIGFVSGDLRDHAVAFFIEPVLRLLSRSAALELHAYYNNAIQDPVTSRIRGYLKHWHAVATLSDDELAQKVTADGIDILIDLSGHTALNRLRAFARKPAPIQVSWLGYPGSTGLLAMDYYLADPLWLPPGQFDALFTEKLAYLPDRWTFQPHATAPPVNALPALAAGHLTFGSFNRMGKINPSTIALWSQLLRALPDARMLLGGMPTEGEQGTLIEEFAGHGIARERLSFRGRSTTDAYLALHHQVDLCLDTHPYAGGTITMHALWMGVPTLTLAGSTSFARAGAGILAQLGLDGFTAESETDFVAKGRYWATHLEELAQLRAGLRPRMQRSASGQPQLIAAHLERALRQMWRRWCAALPVQSFDSADPAIATPIDIPKQLPANQAEQHRETLVVQQQFAAVSALIDQGRLDEGLVMARAMTTRFPEQGLAWKTLGALLWWKGWVIDAVVPMQTAARLLPHDVEALSNLGMALLKSQRFEEAETHLRRALEFDQNFAGAHYHLGMTYVLLGRYTEAEASLRTAFSLSPDYRDSEKDTIYSDLLFLTSNNPEVSADSLFAEHRQFGEYFETPLRASWPRHANSKDPERRLKIGFVSGDLRDHAVAFFIEPVLAQLQHSAGLELHAYHNHTVGDQVTVRLHAHVAHWHAVAALSDGELAQKILADGIDILIDLSGHTGLNRLRSFAHKPAPIQVSWLGYPGTTGLHAMDYYLADPLWLPPGQFDAQFTEKLVYLPDRWSFQPHATAPPVNALPALAAGSATAAGWAAAGSAPSAGSAATGPAAATAPATSSALAAGLAAAGHFTFGSFNRLGKINPSTIRLWSQLLRALPDARMLLGGMPTEGEQGTLIEEFAGHGIARERLSFRGRSTTDAYLALHHQVDLCLDTHPYAGGTITMHALWMGVPTLTLAGSTSFARAGAGILAQLGLDGFTAESETDFVAKGRYWATHLEELAQLRAGLRPRMQRSASGQPQLIAAHLERALRQMWRRWCAALPVQSFDSADPAIATLLDIPKPTRAHRRRESRVAGEQEKVLLALMRQRRFADALAQARSMTLRFPEHGLGWKILGALMGANGSTEDALAAMLTSVRLLPQDAEAHSNLGTTFAQLKRYDEAEIYHRRALEIDPAFASAYYRLGMCYELQGLYAKAEVSLRTGISLRTNLAEGDDEQNFSNLLFILSHNAALDADSLFAEHRQFGEYFETPLRASWPQHANPKDPERRLKIGFVSADLRDHAVASFIEPVLAQLQRSPGLELHAYYNNAIRDQVTVRLRAHVPHWHVISTLSDSELAQKIIADGIDILIDLSGHTALNRLRAFARKPAPIQVSWLGYPGTTGLLAMDYYLADPAWLPPGQFDALFTEKLVYLPDRWTFQPHATAPPVNALPALAAGSALSAGLAGSAGSAGLAGLAGLAGSATTGPAAATAPATSSALAAGLAAAGHFTFGSFNRLGKINPSTVRLWSQLLHALPDARMLLGGMPAEGEQRTLIEEFAGHGIARERLSFRGRSTTDAYLALHHQVDLCLDTHPYAGGTITMHALWMGVPTLTLAGSTSFARAGAGILAQLGLDGFTAETETDFVAKGRYWATHLEELAQLRAGMRLRMQRSASGQPELIAAHLERALRQMWRRWCAALPVQSFDSLAAAE